MNLPNLSLGGEILTSRLDVLENWTVRLSEYYDQIMSRVERLEASHKHHDALSEHENQLMRIIELFMEDDVRACTVMDYVIVFFRLVLAKLRQRGQDFDDVKQLHKALSDEDVAQTLRTALSKLGFPTAEQRAIRIVLEVLQHRKWPTSQVMTTSPGGDAQISAALLYLRLQQDLQPVMSSALQRALCAAHECILTDMAISKATGHDVNINASDVRKDDAYVDARVKYEDYASFDRHPREEKRSGQLLSAEGGADGVDDGKEGGRLHSCSDASESVLHKGGNTGGSFEEGAFQKSFQATPSARCSNALGMKVGAPKTVESVMVGKTSFTKSYHDAPHTSCPESTNLGLDMTKAGEGTTDDKYPDKLDSSSPGDSAVCCAAERENPTTLDHTRLAHDPTFYVLCYDVTSPSSGNLSTGDGVTEGANERMHLRHRPGSHVLRATNETASNVEATNQKETRRENMACD